MVASQNGWVANAPDRVASQLVPGTAVSLRVRKDSPGLLLLEVASAFDRTVQDIDNARGALDDWGYAEREIRGGVELSNHASGTAIDLNATRWPLGSEASVNLNAAQIAQVRRIVGVTGGVVRWGGDYTGRKDPMHFEINDGQDLADCDRALAAMREFNAAAATTPTEETELNADQARMLQEIHRESTQRLGRRIDGSTYSDTVLGFAMNADSFGYRAAEALGRIEDRLDDISERLTALEGTS